MVEWWKRFDKEVGATLCARFADFMQKLYERLGVLSEEQIDDLFLSLDNVLEQADENS